MKYRAKILKILIVIIILHAIFGLISNKVVLANEDKSFLNIDNSDSDYDYDNYSEAYKEYLKLSDEEKSKIYVIPRKYDVPLDSLYEDTVIEQKSTQYRTVSAYESEIPQSFNLRNRITIPEKNQGSYGLCAAFASMRSLETNIALHEGINCDLSELHFDYIMSKDLGLYNHSRNIHDAVSFSEFKQYCVDNYGPVDESKVPYSSTYSANDYEYLKNIQTKVYVTEFVDFPTIDKANKTYTDEELKLFRDKVKKHIMENGSVYSIIQSTSIKSINGNNTVYNPSNSFNHAISIIGWDDNFSRDNFKDENGNKPKKNGAYIAVNSWGPNDILYISYETGTIETEMAGVVSATTDINKVNKANVMFPDKNLYNEMKNILKRSMLSYNDNTQTISLIKTARESIDLDRKKIINLQGLENFNKVKQINLNNNFITDISPLKYSTKIQRLYLKNNSINDISTLANMKELRYLYLSDNKNISNLIPLKNLLELKVLDLKNCSITNVSQLRKLTNLEELDLYGNEIEDISVLSNLKKIKILNLKKNKISDVSILESLENLDELYLNDNTIKLTINESEANIEIELPQIIKESLDNKSIIYSKEGLNCLNCRLSEDKKHITINDVTKLKSYAIIKSGQAQGTTFYVNIKPKELESINIITPPSKKEYIEGQNFDKAGMKVKAIYNDGSEKEVTNYTIENGDSLKSGQKTVTIKYVEDEITKTIEQQITVINKSLSSIKIQTLPSKTEYIEGQNFDKTGMKVKAIYNDGSEKEIVNYTVENGDSLKSGQKTVTIKYVEDEITKTIEQQITVINKSLSSIKIQTSPSKTEYIEGQNFDKTGMKVKAIYNDGSEKEVTNYTVENGNNLKPSQTTVIIKYIENGIEKTIEQKITVKEKLKPGLEEYEVVEEKGKKYIENIVEATTIEEFENKINTNGTIEIYEGNTKITDKKEVIGTGMVIKIKLNEEEETYIAVVKGDLTGDGKVKIADLLKLARYHAKLDTQLSISQIKAGDVIKNDKIGMPDILKLSRVLAKMEDI